MSKGKPHLKSTLVFDPPLRIALKARPQAPPGPGTVFSPRQQGPIHPPPLGVPWPRCPVKGCVFPAASHGGEQCLLHDLTEREPKHFRSLQPSTLLLDQAKFAIPSPEHEDSRARDRRRLALVREKMLDEVA